MVGATRLFYATASPREKIKRACDGVGRVNKAARKPATVCERVVGHITEPVAAGAR